jgi:hypothetical protein
MKKRLILGARCVCESASDIPTDFTIVITDDLAARIRKLHEAVETLGVHSINEFCFEGCWGTCDTDPDAEAVEMLVSIRATSARVDMPMLRVTEEGFFFTAVPKHCGDDMTLRTVPYVAISDLDNDQLFVALEG